MSSLHTTPYVTEILQNLIGMPPEKRVHIVAELSKATREFGGIRRVTMRHLCEGKTQKQLSEEIGIHQTVISAVIVGTHVNVKPIDTPWRVRLRINGEWHQDTITAGTGVEAATIYADRIRNAYGTNDGILPLTAVRVEPTEETP